MLIEPQSFQIGRFPPDDRPFVCLNFYPDHVPALIEKIFKPHVNDGSVRVGVGFLDDTPEEPVETSLGDYDDDLMELAVYCHIETPDEIPDLPCSVIPIHHRDSSTIEYLIGGITDASTVSVLWLLKRFRELGSFQVLCGYHQPSGQRVLANASWSARLTEIEDADSVYHHYYTHFRLEENFLRPGRIQSYPG